MNSCILMAQIIEDPQLRYTQDNQTAIAEMKVQFSGLRPEEPAVDLKVIGWGNFAQEMVQKYHSGDQVVLEGRLGMNTIERPEGFKEKRAEMTVSRIYAIGEMAAGASAMPAMTMASELSAPAAAPAAKATTTKAKKAAPVAEPEPDFDEIPF
jgi:single-strand DNA-binding protein